MYVEILSTAIAADDGYGDVPALIGRVRQTRVKLHEAGCGDPVSVYDAIAAEVAYDRALVQLCGKCGIETETACFASPTTERQRLERELAIRGIDLAEADDDS